MKLPELQADKLASHSDRITAFGWWLQVHKGKAHFQQADVAQCYRKLSIAEPTSYGGYFANLVTRGDLLKAAAGYKLESKARSRLEKKYGQRETTVQVTQLLAGLPSQLPSLAERTYLDEALICYRHGAFRAAVVMTWNVAYAHLCDHVLRNKLAEFNAAWQTTFPGMHKNKVKTIASLDDFRDKLQESEVLTICRDGGIVTRGVYNVMQPGLVKRNSAAHPSGVLVDQLQADAYISDLITNGVLKIA